MPITPKQMETLLKQHGFEYLRSNGSHRMYQHPVTHRQAVIPFHAKDLKPGTERNIRKQAALL